MSQSTSSTITAVVRQNIKADGERIKPANEKLHGTFIAYINQ
jgi:hypothetical protein